MKNKGFTLIELLGVIVILGIISSIATASYYKYLKYSQDKSFTFSEKTLIETVQDAYIDCSAGKTNDFCTNRKLLGTKDEEIKVYLYELINDGYAKKIKDPYNTDKTCSTDSYVKVHNKDSSGKMNINITYDVCLICGNKKSETCE